MKKEDCKVKVGELIHNKEDGLHLLFERWLEVEANRLLDSGGVGFDEYDDNYHLPKVILAVALRNFSEEYLLGNDKKGRKTFNNLRKF